MVGQDELVGEGSQILADLPNKHSIVYLKEKKSDNKGKPGF